MISNIADMYRITSQTRTPHLLFSPSLEPRGHNREFVRLKTENVAPQGFRADQWIVRPALQQFQTAYVGADYHPVTNQADDEPAILELITDSGDIVNLLPHVDSSYPSTVGQQDEPYPLASAISETIANYARKYAIKKMPPILLPPLEERITLNDPFAAAKIGGWDGKTWQPAGFDHASKAISTGSAPIGMVDDVFNRKQALLISDLSQDEQFGTAVSIIAQNICSIMCVPLISQGELYGILQIENTSITNPFTEKDLNDLVGVAKQAAFSSWAV